MSTEHLTSRKRLDSLNFILKPSGDGLFLAKSLVLSWVSLGSLSRLILLIVSESSIVGQAQNRQRKSIVMETCNA